MNLLVMSGGKHPYHQSTPILTDFLSEAGHEVDVTEDADALVSDSMPEYDALVYNTRRVEEMTLNDAQRKALTQYVGAARASSSSTAPQDCRRRGRSSTTSPAEGGSTAG